MSRALAEAGATVIVATHSVTPTHSSVTAGSGSGSGGTGAATASASTGKDAGNQTASYRNGMAVFTYAKGGLMYEASLGGQKFKFKPSK